MSAAQIKEVLEEIDIPAIKLLISELQEEYSQLQRSFNITEAAGGYRIGTLPVYAPWLNKLYRKSRAARLSASSLETLAIIAYKQPITRQEIEEVRGVNVDAVIRRLLEKSLIRISGRKQIPGKPFFYSTTKQFLELFGLQSLSELPRLEEFENVGIELQNVSETGREAVEETGTAEIVAASDRETVYPTEEIDAEGSAQLPEALTAQNGGEGNGPPGRITPENRPD